MNIEKQIAKILTKKKLTLAVAESCTGGLISNNITDIPGSSKFFKGGIVAYSNDIKTFFLNVPGTIIKKYGAVSGEVAISMAVGARKAMDTDIAVSITGIAGPTGGTKEKPIGLAYLAFSSEEKNAGRKVLVKGNRSQMKEQFAKAALNLILKCI
ncbi:MAG: CinA family protein [Candidatus Omnitrophota bacterium]